MPCTSRAPWTCSHDFIQTSPMEDWIFSGFQPIWYKHPLWDPTLSLLVSWSPSANICLFVTIFALLWKKMWSFTKANILKCIWPCLISVIIEVKGKMAIFVNFCHILFYFWIVVISNVRKYAFSPEWTFLVPSCIINVIVEVKGQVCKVIFYEYQHIVASFFYHNAF